MYGENIPSNAAHQDCSLDVYREYTMCTQCTYDVCTYIKSNPPHELAIELSSRSLTSLFHLSLATGCDIWYV